MTRLLDFFFSLFGILTLSPLLILLWIFGLFENGSPIFKQIRVGYYQKTFKLFKFRTMPLGTKSAATHLVKNLKLSFFSIQDCFILLQKIWVRLIKNSSSSFWTWICLEPGLFSFDKKGIEKYINLKNLVKVKKIQKQHKINDTCIVN